MVFIPSIHFLTCCYPFGVTGLLKPAPAAVGRRQGIPWTGYLYVTGEHNHTHSHLGWFWKKKQLNYKPDHVNSTQKDPRWDLNQGLLLCSWLTCLCFHTRLFEITLQFFKRVLNLYSKTFETPQIWREKNRTRTPPDEDGRRTPPFSIVDHRGETIKRDYIYYLKCSHKTKCHFFFSWS